MNVFIRAIVTGFGFSLGKALFDKVSERIGLSEGESDTPPVDDDDHSTEDDQSPVLA